MLIFIIQIIDMCIVLAKTKDENGNNDKNFHIHILRSVNYNNSAL